MLVGCQLLTLTVPALGPRSAAAQTAPTSLRRGQDYYNQSRFDDAILLLKDLVDRGLLSGDDLVKAREVIARSYVKKGYPAKGREMFKAILRDRSDWRPDPIRVPRGAARGGCAEAGHAGCSARSAASGPGGRSRAPAAEGDVREAEVAGLAVVGVGARRGGRGRCGRGSGWRWRWRWRHSSTCRAERSPWFPRSSVIHGPGFRAVTQYSPGFE
jgi:hypothetical protein